MKRTQRDHKPSHTGNGSRVLLLLPPSVLSRSHFVCIYASVCLIGSSYSGVGGFPASLYVHWLKPKIKNISPSCCEITQPGLDWNEFLATILLRGTVGCQNAVKDWSGTIMNTSWLCPSSTFYFDTSSPGSVACSCNFPWGLTIAWTGMIILWR